MRTYVEMFKNLDGTLTGSMKFYKLYAASPSSQPYFTGFVMINASFRFYLALKATKVFGPFTKLIKLNLINLMPWLLTTTLILLILAASLHTLLAEDQNSCSTIYSCLKVMI